MLSSDQCFKSHSLRDNCFHIVIVISATGIEMPNSNVEPRAILIVPCAGGWMRRSVSCMETSSNTLVEEHHCNSVSKPASNNYCTQTPCTASYVLNIFTPAVNPLTDTLKPESKVPLYSNAVIGTLAAHLGQ